MKTRTGTRLLSSVLILLMLLSSLLAVLPVVSHAETVEKQKTKRVINVVLDDSNSMLTGGRTAWVQARYALQVFASMMQADDVMNVYVMSEFSDGQDERKINPRGITFTLKGSEPKKNIETIRSDRAVTFTRGTPFPAITKAYEDLKPIGGFTEKWLVVLTDGDAFDGGENAGTMNTLFADSAASGIDVAYLAINTGSTPIKPSANASVAVYEASGNDAQGAKGILAQVAQIAQRIFQRPDISCSFADNKLRFNIDIPTSEIVVFAQGDGIQTGDLSVGAKKTLVEAVVKSSDKATTQDRTDAGKLSLNGQIATFTPSDGAKYFSAGDFTVDVKNGQSGKYSVYYKPCLDVMVDLTDKNGNIISQSNYSEIMPGEYKVAYSLVIPGTRTKVESKMISAKFECAKNGTQFDTKTGTSGVSTVVLTNQGQNVITVSASYLNFVSQDASVAFVVVPTNNIKVVPVFNSPEYQRSYDLDEMTAADKNKGFLVEIREDDKAVTGKELTDHYELSYSCSGMDFDVKKTDKGFLFTPKYKSGNKDLTATGTVEFDLTATRKELYNGKFTAKSSIEVTYVPPLDLKITFDEYENERLLTQLEKGSAIKAHVTNGDGTPVDSALWDSLDVRFACEGIDLAVKKGSAGEFTLQPKYKNGKMDDTVKDATAPFSAWLIRGGSADDRCAAESGAIYVKNDTKAELSLEIGQFQSEISNKNFRQSSPSLPVTILWNGENLTREQYDALEFDEVTFKKQKDYFSGSVINYLAAEIEKDPYVEGEPTTATIRFHVKGEDPNSEDYKKAKKFVANLSEMSNLKGASDFNVSAHAKYGPYSADGSTSGRINVKDRRTFWEKFFWILLILLILLLIALILLAYLPIIKKYFPVKIGYRNRLGNKPALKPYSLNNSYWWTILVPFMAMRFAGQVQTEDNSRIPLSMKSTGGNNAELENVMQLEGRGYTVPGTKTRKPKGKKNAKKGSGTQAKRYATLRLQNSKILEDGDWVVEFCKNRGSRKKGRR